MTSRPLIQMTYLLGTRHISAWFTSFATVLLLCLCTTAAESQVKGTVRGALEDPTGLPVSQVEVGLINQSTGQVYTALTSDDGRFQFDGVPFGDFELSVSAPGMKEKKASVTVGESPARPLQLRLEVADVNQKVEVAADALSVPLANQNIDALELERHMLDSLPTKEADPLAVPAMFLNPALAGAQGPKIIVDGFESDAAEVPSESISKVYVDRSPYSAEYGRPGKDRLEVTTRKGSRNYYHGNILLLGRYFALDARNAFAKTKPPMQREIAEAEFDGPAGKNVRFLFAGRSDIDNDSAVVHAHTLTGPVIENAPVPTRGTRLFGRLDFQLNPTHSLMVGFKFKDRSVSNQGAGGFVLPEDATNFHTNETELKIIERAIPNAHLINEFRFQFRNGLKKTTSVTDSPAIVVQGAFTGGGAQIFQERQEKGMDFQDAATLISGRHALHFGGDIRPRFFQTHDQSNFGGTYTFGSLAAFAANQPILFTLNQGIPEVNFGQHDFSVYLQDEISLRETLSLSLGLRQEWQTNVARKVNIAPRLAFAYSPGGRSTVLRGGAGIFYDRQPEVMEQQSLLYGGLYGRQFYAPSPTYPLPVIPATPSILRIAPGMVLPYLAQASIGVERSLGKGKNYISAEYTIIRGYHLYRTRNTNAPLQGTGARPDPSFLNINQFESSGKSRGQVATVTFQTTLFRRFSFFSQYNFSRTNDDTSGMFSLPANNYDLRGEYGRADYDRRHRFSLAGVYGLPWGLRAGTIASISSGIPFNITTGFDDNGDAVPNDRPAGVTRNTGSGPGYASIDVHLSKVLCLARCEGRRTLPRSAGESMVGILAVNSSPLQRDHGARLELGVDAFNVLNHVNPENFVGVLSSKFFGGANAANPPRQLQVSAKIHF